MCMYDRKFFFFYYDKTLNYSSNSAEALQEHCTLVISNAIPIVYLVLGVSVAVVCLQST